MDLTHYRRWDKRWHGFVMWPKSGYATRINLHRTIRVAKAWDDEPRPIGQTVFLSNGAQVVAGENTSPDQDFWP